MTSARLHNLVDAARRVPLLAWSITGLFVTLLLAYSILLPTFRAPDEPQHVDVARLFSEEARYPAWDDRDIDAGVIRSLPLVGFHNPRGSAHLTEDEAAPKDERPSFEELGEAPAAPSPNQIPQHPPAYYVVAGSAEAAVEVVAGDPSYDVEVWLYRLVSIALVAPLPLIIWHLARVLSAPAAVGYAAALVPLAIPQLTHIGASVNNDNLMLLAFWAVTPTVLRLGRGHLAPRTAVLAGALTGLGLLTKGFALVLPAWIGGALALAWWRADRDGRRAAVRAGLVYGATALVTGGWWWIRNVVLYGNLSPSRFDELVADRDDFDVELGNFVQSWAYRTTRRFWGDFGWYDTAIPTLAFGLATAVVVAGLVLALTRRDRLGGSPIGDRFLLAAPLLLLVVTQFAFALRGYLKTSQLPGMQGRYWFGALAGAAVVVAVGYGNLLRRHAHRLPLLVLAAVGGMQLVGAYTVLRHYWGPASSPITDRLRAVVAWAPMPGELIAVGAMVGAVVALATLVQVVRLAWRGTGDDVAGDGTAREAATDGGAAVGAGGNGHGSAERATAVLEPGPARFVGLGGVCWIP
jgi:small subunit ribosomal protein S36